MNENYLCFFSCFGLHFVFSNDRDQPSLALICIPSLLDLPVLSEWHWITSARCDFLCMHAQSCPTLCNPVVAKPTRLLCPRNFPDKNTGWVAVSSSRGSFWPKDRVPVSCISCIGRQIVSHLVPPGKSFLKLRLLSISCTSIHKKHVSLLRVTSQSLLFVVYLSDFFIPLCP